MDKNTEKEIIQILKNQGLEVAEDMAVNAVKSAVVLLKMLIPKVSTGFGKAFIFFIDMYLPEILALLDKIDGKDNPEY